ncbi:DJ-1/PfpI family protein [Sphingomonas sp.]|uniref:DJ-1/PfpI family protein n=1 Tax=Sphingomonas sp. TaxID=28214 RepID=UPI002DD64D5A|nr:DJ-1/PfpI family protein [Sphingomonas sp.]
MSDIRVAFLLFPQVTQLDLAGPAQLLSRLKGARIDLVAATRDPVATDSGFAILPTATFDDVTAADILCIPGGFGTGAAMADPATRDWVRRVGEGAQWVTSVCTGALILGAAGLLDGYRATTHWASHEYLELFGAIPVADRVVFDRNRVTGGGVTAGIDFALALIAAIQGEDHARFVQLSVEYDPAPPFDAGTPARAGTEAIARYRDLAARMNPDRDARMRGLAAELRG